MAQYNVAVVGHGNWDRVSRFTVPHNITIGYFYPAESETALCYSENQIEGLCRQPTVDTRGPGQQTPDFSLTSGMPWPTGVRNCTDQALIMRFEDGRTYMLSALITSLSGMAPPGVTVFVRMLVCGGGKSSIMATTGAPAGVGDLNEINAMHAYNNAISLGAPEHIARRFEHATRQGMTPEQARAYAMSGYGRRRRRKGTKRISRRRRKTIR
jgi:hypothetical protein